MCRYLVTDGQFPEADGRSAIHIIFADPVAVANPLVKSLGREQTRPCLSIIRAGSIRDRRLHINTTVVASLSAGLAIAVLIQYCLGNAHDLSAKAAVDKEVHGKSADIKAVVPSQRKVRIGVAYFVINVFFHWLDVTLHDNLISLRL